MSEFDRAPREYRSPPLSDIQNSLPERKVWTGDPISPQEVIIARRIRARAEGDLRDLDKKQFWKGFSLGGLTGILLTGLLPIVFVLLDAPGAY